MRPAHAKRVTGIIAAFLVLFGAVNLQAQTGPTYYYVSPNGNDSSPGTESLPWKTFAKATSMATGGVTVFIKQGVYRERLVPVSSGTADGPITFTSYPGDSVTINGLGIKLPSGQGSSRWWSGLIHVEGLSYIKISGLRVVNSEASGVLVTNSNNITIEKNYIDSTYSPGIAVNTAGNLIVDGNEVVHACIGWDQECISIAAANLFEIKNNRVHDGFTEGIDVKVGSSNGMVSNNEVYNQGRSSGIYVEAWDKHEFNIDVFDNISHNNVQGLSVASEDGGLLDAIKLHNNKSYSNQQYGFCVAGWGIAQAHPMKNIEFYGNASYDNQFGFDIGGYSGTIVDSIRIHNNLIYHNRSSGISMGRFDALPGPFTVGRIELINNTVFGNGTSSSGWGDGGINITNMSPQIIVVRNNILSSNAAYTICVQPEVPRANVTIDYNFFDGFQNYPNETAGTNPVYGIPLFVDTLTNDYHLRATSPCIDKGHPDQMYNDPADPMKPSFALYPAQGTLRNDIGAYGGPYATSLDLATSLGKPQTPLPSSPADSARSVSIKPTLSWNMILGADRYRVQLSTSASFSNKLVDDSTVTDCYRQVGPLQNNTTYYWRLSAANVAGTSSYSTVRTFTTTVASAVEQLGGMIPKEYALRQNYPNPFNPATTIRFELPKSSYVSLKVFDVLGKEVKTLVSQKFSPGYFTIRWNANVSSGIYFYRLQAGQYVETKKMILLR